MGNEKGTLLECPSRSITENNFLLRPNSKGGPHHTEKASFCSGRFKILFIFHNEGGREGGNSFFPFLIATDHLCRRNLVQLCDFFEGRAAT